MEQTEDCKLKNGQETPFDFIETCDTEMLSTVLQQENPLIISLLLGSLSSHKAAAVLQALPDSIQLPVIEDLACGSWESADVLELIAADIRKKIEQHTEVPYIELGGIAFLRKIANGGDFLFGSPMPAENMLGCLKDTAPAAYAALQEHVLLFEDIAQLDDSSIQKLMREVNSWELARALKTASPALMGKIQRNMSARAFAMLKEEMDYMRPITMSDVREAEQRIIWILRHLIEEGSIVLPHKRKENLSTIKENDIG